jgi:hypothetical protein
MCNVTYYKERLSLFPEERSIHVTTRRFDRSEVTMEGKEFKEVV